MMLSKLFSNFKTSLYKNYGENPGKMLVHTGALGWVLSSLAQIISIAFNDKISTEQKSFLIPQEIADAGVNILSFYIVTSSFKNLASKLVSTGKLNTKPIKNFLEKHKLTDKIGKLDFNIEKLNNYSEIKPDYKPFKNGIDVVASTIGSIISCNIITPIFRNQYASKKQKQIVARINTNSKINLIAPRGLSMADYQKLSAMKYSNSSLKI